MTGEGVAPFLTMPQPQSNVQGSPPSGTTVLRVFICFLKAGILVEVSGEGPMRIFNSFPGVSFNMLMHQNEHMEFGIIVSFAALLLSTEPHN